MRTEPAAIAFTSPLDETVAIAGDSLLHTTTRPASTDPLVSRGEAVNRSESPTVSSVVSGETTTLVTKLVVGTIGTEPEATGPSVPQAVNEKSAAAASTERNDMGNTDAGRGKDQRRLPTNGSHISPVPANRFAAARGAQYRNAYCIFTSS